jgi:hypothetical protein
LGDLFFMLTRADGHDPNEASPIGARTSVES